MSVPSDQVEDALRGGKYAKWKQQMTDHFGHFVKLRAFGIAAHLLEQRIRQHHRRQPWLPRHHVVVPIMKGADALLAGSVTHLTLQDAIDPVVAKLHDNIIKPIHEITAQYTPVHELVHRYRGAAQDPVHEEMRRRLLSWDTLRMTNQSYVKPAERLNIRMYKYDRTHSTDDHAFWVNHNTKTVHHAIRGSVTREDFLDTAPKLVMNRLTPRYKAVLSRIHAAHAKYPDYTVEGSGHSAGGTLATLVVKELGGQEWVGHHTAYKTMTSPLIPRQSDHPNAHKLTHYVNPSDPVSIASVPFGKVVHSGEQLSGLGLAAHLTSEVVQKSYAHLEDYLSPGRGGGGLLNRGYIQRTVDRPWNLTGVHSLGDQIPPEHREAYERGDAGAEEEEEEEEVPPPGHSTTFTMPDTRPFPWAREVAEEDEQPQEEAAPGPTGTPRILGYILYRPEESGAYEGKTVSWR